MSNRGQCDACGGDGSLYYRSVKLCEKCNGGATAATLRTEREQLAEAVESKWSAQWGDETKCCAYCKGTCDYQLSHECIEHEPDCPVLLARRILKEGESDG